MFNIAKHSAWLVFGMFALVVSSACSDEPSAPRGDPEAGGLPVLSRGVGDVPIATPGGRAPSFSAGVAGAMPGMPAMSATAPAAPAASSHVQHLLLENSSTGARALWVVSAGSIVGSANLGTVAVAWHIVGSGDFNADGFEDVLWENVSDGSRAIWFMDGNGRVTTSASLGIVPVEWHIAGGGDYDADGKDDILWENTSTGSRAIWLMNDATLRTSAVIGTVSVNWHMIATHDLNSDSKSDILLEEKTNGNRVLWMMSAARVQNSLLLGTLSTSWKLSTTTDIDGDAHTDILFENTSTGARVVWVEDGMGHVNAGPVLTTLAPVWHIAAALTPDRGGFPAGFTLSTNSFISSGLTAPVFLTQPLNDGRIFVVEQPGRIRVVRNGVLQSTPFLDVSSKLIYDGERGLLSVAFHPQYATNHYFYVYFVGLNGEIRIERFTTSANPEVADVASEKLIFTTPHPSYENHNGGLVSFGPDGMLYAAFGDGGGSGDPSGNAQNFNAYLGGMIRIDVDRGDPYAVPADNPFVGQADRKPELWAKGLRNPWRYAFDPPSGLLFIADVGEDVHEEIDVMSASQGGLNYGWNIMEGINCFNASSCNETGLQVPVLDYGHDNGACSITGGYVYRGNAIPGLRGHYLYSDYCAGFLKSVRYQNGVAVDTKDWGITLPVVTSFGRDYAGELYIMTGNNIVKIVQGS